MQVAFFLSNHFIQYNFSREFSDEQGGKHCEIFNRKVRKVFAENAEENKEKVTSRQ